MSLDSILDRLAGQPVIRRRKKRRRPPRFFVELLENRALLAPITVTDLNPNADNGNDIGLAIAIADSNLRPHLNGTGPNIINFAIPGSGVQTIALTQPLIPITSSVIIDATTEANIQGVTYSTPLIDIDGTHAGKADGLDFTVGGNTVKGLIVNNFSGTGIILDGTNDLFTGRGQGPGINNTIQENLIGTDATGQDAAPNKNGGIEILNSSYNLIGGLNSDEQLTNGNLISGNGENGVFLASALDSHNYIEGNYIGTAITGLQPIAGAQSGSYGVALVPPLQSPNLGYATNNYVADFDPNEMAFDPQGRNIISGNTADGVLVVGGSGNQISGNYIGLGSNGTTPIANGEDGILLEDASSNIVGGTQANAGNVISANGHNGVAILADAATEYGLAIPVASQGAFGNIVTANYIGTDATGDLSLILGSSGTQPILLGNAHYGVVVENDSTDPSVAVLNNVIGGQNTNGQLSAGNLISGNLVGGVLLAGPRVTLNALEGNYIGTDKTGTQTRANSNVGLEINSVGLNTSNAPGQTGPFQNLIGGGPGDGNVISGNGTPALGNNTAATGEGVLIANGSNANILEGNDIGTTANGLAKLANVNGVVINNAANNVVGDGDAGNVISGNTVEGVLITGSQATGNYVQNDRIGMAANFSQALANQDGVVINNQASGNFVGNVETAGGLTQLMGNTIAGNTANGVLIQDGAFNNQVLANGFGIVELGILNAQTDPPIGTAIVGNQTGIKISNAHDNIIGGPLAADRNYLENSVADAIDVTNSVLVNGTPVTTGNIVEGDYIGVGNDGARELGNFGNGVKIDSAAGNFIGTLVPGTGNVISSNLADGVLITGPAATGNQIAGNRIGTSADGTAARANFNGVEIDNGATQNFIGLLGDQGRNVISGNSAGVVLQNAGPSNLIANDYIGLNAAGTDKLTDTQNTGIAVFNSPNTLVGGTSAGLGNVVSGNTADDIVVASGSSGTQILGNYVGTDKDAAKAIANNSTGIAIIPTKNSTVPVAANVTISGNTIGGNTDIGIDLTGGTSNDTIQDNYIGETVTGGAIPVVTPIPNTGIGILISSSQGNTVGGAGNARNVIGLTQKDPTSTDLATGSGIVIDGSATNANGIASKQNNFVVNNTISGNQDDGIVLRNGAIYNIIGLPGQGNTITGNGANGIAIIGGGTYQNQVQANFIGITSVTGSKQGLAAGNSGAGIGIFQDASSTIIGGQAAESANVISANKYGVVLRDAAAKNSILGNLIGTALDGSFQAGFGNEVGIYSLAAGTNTIGGPTSAYGTSPGNKILGNGVGIEFLGGTDTDPSGFNYTDGGENKVQGNEIAHSTFSGVEFMIGASNDQIGGPNRADGNTIHDNGSDGVSVISGNNDSILFNQIFNNAGLGIHLTGPLLFGTGGNDLLAAPHLSLATTGGSSRLAGWIQATPNTTYIIEFFSGSQNPTSGAENDDAENFVVAPSGLMSVNTDSNGFYPFDISLNSQADSVIRATATVFTASGTGDTSQFSNAVVVSPDSDGDGEPDNIEANAPSGLAKRPGVVTFQDAVNENPQLYVTLKAQTGVTFQKAWSTPMPAPPDQGGPPPGTVFPFGFASFTLANVPASPVPVVVTMFLPNALPKGTVYWKYGPTHTIVAGGTVIPGDGTPHWYPWNYPQPDGTGADIEGNMITLHFVKGGLGDDDLDLTDTTIVDPGGPGIPSPYTVTTTADSGLGSLRQAIENADANPGSTITFDLPGTGIQTIQPLSPLPAITASVKIDGSTQPGFAGAPLVVLDGSQAGAGADGLEVASGFLAVQDLVINQFSGDGIHVLSGGSGLIVGNYIGTDASGKVARGNGLYGVEIDGQTPDANDPDNDGDDDNGADGADNDDDERFPVSSTIDGGNVISANLAGGISLHGAKVSGNQITNNFIGTQADGLSPLANGGPGVVIDGGSNDNTIGFEPNTGNTIAYNAGPGIKIGQSIGNFIESNSIFANQGLGIDLAGGQSSNDSQSAPVLASASSYGGQTFISGTLTSAPNSSYTIDFYATDKADALGGAQGRFVLGTVTVTSDNNGHASFDVDLAASAAPGSLITATAISSTFDSKTFSTVFNTSQFSAPLALTPTNPMVFIVNTTDDVNDAVPDPTHFSLREAILSANAHPGQDIIDFDLPNSNRLIQPHSALPAITDPVIIDGTSQPGYLGLPLVELDGSQATAGADGLDITGGGSVVRGLAIHSFRTGTDAQGNTIDGHGIEISGQGGNVIEGNFIGTDVTGTRAMPDHGFGEVYIFGSPDNTFGGTTAADRNVTPFVLIEGYDAEAGQPLNNAGGNLVEGNYIGTDLTGTAALSGAPLIGSGITMDVSSGNTIGGTKAGDGNLILGTISIFDASSNVVQGNLIGTNSKGTAALPVGAGVKISGQGFAAQYNLIGGATPAARNIIVGTVDIGGQYNEVEGNYIGTDVTGTVALGPGTGITIESAYNTIGGAQPGEGNLISGNAGGGIALADSANNNVIQGNYIGTDVTGTKALGNHGSGVASSGYANTIGGTTAGAGNLISGNIGDGVLLERNFSPETVEGNLIGTDVTGTVALGNRGDGIDAGVSSPIVGGSQPGAGNIISGNAGNGVAVVTSSGVSIQGNFIGTDVTGRLPLGNGGDGVNILVGQNSVVGGDSDGAGNVIAANGGDGIRVRDDMSGTIGSAPASGTVIQGNKVGTDVTGTERLGNAGDGISIITSNLVATDETIGGPDPGAGNLIAFNGGRGVDMPFGQGNAIRGNDIFDNAEMALVTDLDSAMSTYAEQRGLSLPQTAPVLTSAVFDPQGTVLSGSLTGTPFTRYEIDFFANDAVPAMGFGEGQTYLQSISVLVDDTGSVGFQIPLDDAVPVGQWITATATPDSGDGNTSMFSQPTPVVAAAGNTVQFSSPKYLVTETGGAAEIVVTRSGDTSGAATVHYNTNDGSAIAGVNYTAASGILAFAEGVTTQTIIIPVEDDGLADGDKDFQVVLSNPSGVGLAALSDADITIADSDTAGQLQFSNANYPTIDKALAKDVFTVTRTGGAAGTVTVEYRVTGGTAVTETANSQGLTVSGVDYEDAFGTVTFAPGQTSAQIIPDLVLPFLNGNPWTPEHRGPRTLQLSLGNPTGGAVLGAVTTSTITIDDPENQVGEFGIANQSFSVSENAGKVQIGVFRSGDLTSDVSLVYTTADGTAKAGTNYVATSGFVEFKPGQSQATITIPILDDHVVDNDGAFQFELTGASVINIGTKIPIFPSLSQINVTILDANSPPPPARFEVATNQSLDGYSGTAQVTVDRFDNTSGTDQIHYATSDGTAKAGTDYESASGTLTFAPGQTSLTFSVPLLATDTRTPGDEAFDVTLSNPVSLSNPALGATIDPNNPIPVTLLYNPVGPAQFVSPVYPVADNGANLTITVALTAVGQFAVDSTDHYLPIKVDYSTHDGTATAGADYTAVSGTLSFSPQAEINTITIPILNDLVAGGDKTFSLTLSNPQLGLTLGDLTTTTILILAPNPVTTVPSTTKLTSSAASGSTYGQTETFTATVSAASGTPTGSVDFVDSTTGRDLGSEQLAVVNGVDEASVTVSSLVAGSHTIVATYASDNNSIAGSRDSLAQAIAPATLTVTADNQTMVYGATVPRLTDTITGFVNGDALSVVSGAASLSTSATSAGGVGSYAITIGAGTLSAANYIFDFVNGTLTVTPATLTVTAGDKSMVYGATVPRLTDTITGFVNGDPSSVVSGAASISTASAGVGIYAIEIALGTLSAANYAFAFVDGALTVTPATLTVMADNATMVYGATLPTFTDTISGFVDGDTASVVSGAASLSTTATSASSVGSYPIAVGQGTLSAANYTFTFVDGTLTVSPATLMLTVTADDKTMTYGTPVPELTDTITGFVNGDTASVVNGVASLSTTATSASNVGTYPIDVALGTLSAANYAFVFVDGMLTVTPATLTVAADNKSMVYGATLPALTDTITGFVDGDTASVVAGAASLSTAATSASGVGNYTITVGAGTLSASNYTFNFVSGALSVTPAPLTITANNQTMTYGGSLPALTVTYAGLVNGDTPATFSTSPNVAPTVTAPATDHVGTHAGAIVASGASDPDYTISYAAGTLIVTPAPLTTTANNQTMTYGGSLPTLTVTYTGLVNGDTPATFSTSPNVPPTVTAPATDHVGTHTGAIVASGVSDPDYTISYAAGTLTVTPAPLTITANNQTMTYGGSLPTLTVTYTGLVNGDTPATFGASPDVAPTVIAPATDHVGTHTGAIVASGASDPDYTISYVAGTLTVTPATLTVTADNKTKVYGQANPPLTDTITGFVNGDTASVVSGAASLTTAATTTSGVGNYAINAGLGTLSAADYTFAFVNGVLTVNQDNTTTTVGASVFGLSVTFTATVTADAPGSGTPTGSVDFFDTTTNTDLGSIALSGGTASLTATLPDATQSVTVNYTGDTNFIASNATTSVTPLASVYLLNPSAGGALAASGNAGIEVPGVVVDDSSSTTAITANGNVQIAAGEIDVVGGVRATGHASFSPTPVTGHAVVPDPYRNLVAPSGGTSLGGISLAGNSSLTIQPGVYTQINVSGNAKLTMASGVYVIAGGGLSVSGNASVSGSQVMIYNAGGNYLGGSGFGAVNLSGNGQIAITAPATGPYAGVLLFQARDNQQGLTLSGNAVNGLSGTIYAASAPASVSGNATLNLPVVVNTLTLSGNALLGDPPASSATLSGSDPAVSGFELSPLVNVAVATFTSSDASETASSFTATIDWGDGSSAPGAVTLSNDQFTVSGSHTYGDEGSYSILVSVSDGQASTTIAATANVAEELLAEGTPGTADQRFITEIYRDVLGRQAEPQGRDYWVSHLERGDSRAKVVQDILAAVSEEYHRDLIEAEFARYLNRAPDPAAMQYFSGLLDDGGDAGTLDASLVSSPEYFQEHGGTLDQFIEALFRDALNRPVDPTALAALEARAAQGATRAQIADVVFSSEEYRRDLVATWYQQYLDRAPDAAGMAAFLAQIDAGAPDEHVIAALLSSDEFVAKT